MIDIMWSQSISIYYIILLLLLFSLNNSNRRKNNSNIYETTFIQIRLYKSFILLFIFTLVAAKSINYGTSPSHVYAPVCKDLCFRHYPTLEVIMGRATAKKNLPIGRAGPKFEPNFCVQSPLFRA